MRLITKESRALSRPDGGQPNKEKRRRHGGLVIKSAEGVRFAYSSIATPGFVDGVPTEEYRTHYDITESVEDAENQQQIAPEASE